MNHYLGISGKDSLTTAIILKTHNPKIWASVELFTNDVKTELPEKYAWIDKCEEYLQKPITRIEKDLREIIKRESRSGVNYLPSQHVRYCTRKAKIQPMEKLLDHGVIHIGLRYDERDRKGYTPSEKLTPRYPLIEYQIDLPKVFAILSALDLLPPSYFWERLYLRVEQIINEQSPLLEVSLDQVLSPLQKYILFKGRSRDNCYFCFFQRQAEWLWLLETHPDLFDEALSLEDNAGDYTWSTGGSLRDHIVARKDEIFEKKARMLARQVSQIIYGKPLEVDDDLLDFYTGSSCGLFCGK